MVAFIRRGWLSGLLLLLTCALSIISLFPSVYWSVPLSLFIITVFIATQHRLHGTVTAAGNAGAYKESLWDTCISGTCTKGEGLC